MKKLFYLLALLPILALSQSMDQNWVKSKTYKVPSTTPITAPTPAQAVTLVSYFDGLGRPIQQVAHAQSNSGKDIVTHIEYDQFGRQVKEFLPYASQTTSLNYNSSSGTDVFGFYNTPEYENTLNPFSEKQFEASPLNRILKQAAPGNAWQLTSGNEIKFDYQTNGFEEVKLYKATATWNATTGLYDIAFASTNFYAVNQLYKTITKDENWKPANGNNNTTQEFKDKEGKVVLKRTFNTNEAHDTYYIYDQFGNLTYVIPPAVSGTIAQTKLDNMCYQYKYDYRNRLVEKKLPGKQWEFIVYDKLDRVVATGPAYNPYGAATENDKGWILTKYDVYNRPVYTGWYNAAVNNSTDRKTLQNAYNNATLFSENKTTSTNTINGIATRYSNQVSPSTFILLSVNYYDTYEFPNAPTVPTTLPDSTLPIVDKAKGMPTGSWVRILDVVGSTANELSYTLYDTKYRPVRSYTRNYLGGYTQVDTKLDWAGKAAYTLTKHKRISSSTELITKDMFEYSAQDKLVKHKHKINALPEQLLSFNTYDELGQLISKKVGGADVTGANGFQKVDYTYNIRGWLTGINDINNLAPTATEKDLFAFKLSYNNPENGIALFNGNISETYWRTDSDNILRKYEYSYDNLNRLLEANYKKPGMTLDVDSYLEKLTYDKNGNILSLKRNGDLDTSNFAIQIDDLEYTYHDYKKNELVKVLDKSNHPQGFKDDSNGIEDSEVDYEYDSFGNLISDANKAISDINYNHLNLPVNIVFANGNSISYIYNALGQKVNKIVNENTTVPVSTDYMNGGFQYSDGVLNFFPHAEGYVNVTTFRRGILHYNYVYQYKDHLGNNRLSYSLLEDQLYVPGKPIQFQILEENHYYPFGLKHTSYNTEKYDFVEVEDGNDYYINIEQIPAGYNGAYKYKYNGKELQEELGLNMYDYGARNYDPALGRWMNIDPLAENSRRWTPYTYCYNNPLVFTDPDGMQAVYNWDDGNYYDKGKEVSFDQALNSHGLNADGSEYSNSSWEPLSKDVLIKYLEKLYPNLSKNALYSQAGVSFENAAIKFLKSNNILMNFVDSPSKSSEHIPDGYSAVFTYTNKLNGIWSANHNYVEVKTESVTLTKQIRAFINELDAIGSKYNHANKPVSLTLVTLSDTYINWQVKNQVNVQLGLNGVDSKFIHIIPYYKITDGKMRVSLQYVTDSYTVHWFSNDVYLK